MQFLISHEYLISAPFCLVEVSVWMLPADACQPPLAHCLASLTDCCLPAADPLGDCTPSSKIGSDRLCQWLRCDSVCLDPQSRTNSPDPVASLQEVGSTVITGVADSSIIIKILHDLSQLSDV